MVLKISEFVGRWYDLSATFRDPPSPDSLSSAVLSSSSRCPYNHRTDIPQHGM